MFSSESRGIVYIHEECSIPRRSYRVMIARSAELRNIVRGVRQGTKKINQSLSTPFMNK